MFINEKKMISIKHPFEDYQQVDMIYFDGQLIVAAKNSLRIIQLNVSEVSSQISQFLTADESQAPLIEKEAQGLISQDKICALVSNPVKHELVFICQSSSNQVVPYRLQFNQSEKRQVQLVKIEVDAATSKKSKLDKRMSKLAAQPTEAFQFNVIVKEHTPYLLVARKEQIFEIIQNFNQTIYIEQIPKFQKLLQSFGERVTLQFEDETIAQANTLDKTSERLPLQTSEYYKQLAMPPKVTSLHDINRMIYFYSDMLVVNQSVFIYRDHIIFLYDSFTQQVVNKFFSKQIVVSMHKLKYQQDDESGYKQYNYKIVALQRNGQIITFTPKNTNLMKDWVREDQSVTPITTQKLHVISGFQNLVTLQYLYIKSQNQQGEQKLFQLSFNTKNVIELNQNLSKTDLVFTVLTLSRTRELIGILDTKFLSIYKVDKGTMNLVYKLNIDYNEMKDIFNPQTIFYFSRDSILAITKSKVFKINTQTNTSEQMRLNQVLSSGGACFFDAQYFYFLTKTDDESQNKLSIAGINMIQAAFQKNQKSSQNAIVDLDDEMENTANNNLYYPHWEFKSNIKKIDFDEFNQVVNLMLSDFQVIQVPLYHRNTINFMGMAERTFYLAFKKNNNHFFALDKENYMNCWSMKDGKLLSRNLIEDQDFKKYECDRKIYDKDWFPFSLVYTENHPVGINDSVSDQFKTFKYKVIEIDNKGSVIEKVSFLRQEQQSMDVHYYFNTEVRQMIEVLIQRNKKTKATYNLYDRDDNNSEIWIFSKTLSNDQDFQEWHQRSLYPYNLNLETFEQINAKSIGSYELYKLVAKDKIKVLNVQDGIEMIFNEETGKLESFLALQYSFQNIKDSFYDNRSGQFFVQEVTLRLQSYYEEFRKQILLYNNLCSYVSDLDVTTKQYKYKYLIEQSYTEFDYEFYKQFIKGQENEASKVLKTLSVDQIQRLIHNIFPDRNNTLMHYIAHSNMGFECIDYLNEKQKSQGFVIPFLMNTSEKTPLDITVELKDFKQSNSIIKMLSKTPMDHHSKLISNLLPKIIEMGLPSLEKYFDKRQFSVGICKQITLGRIKIDKGQEFKAIPSTLINENPQQVRDALMNQNYKEQSLALEILDIPLTKMKSEIVVKSHNQKLQKDDNYNEYEIQLIKSFANTENSDIFTQKSVRAYVDFLWPKSRKLIIQNLFLPYLAFILYYMLYLVVLKRLNNTQQNDPGFFKFTSDMFVVYDFMFKMILFLGCFYFFYQDFLQIKNFATNKIVLWSYANIFPLIIMIFIIAYDTFIDTNSPYVEKAFYSATAFFIWIRVLHLLQIFSQPAYLLRMSAQIVYKMRYLIVFIFISIIAFGFTFYFLQESADITPYHGIEYMLLMLVGNYDYGDFHSIYLSIFFVMVNCFNYFFIFTLLISLAVNAISLNESDSDSNQAYQEKASLIALYSYLLSEKAVRDPSKKYLLIANVKDAKAKNENLKSQSQRVTLSDISKLQDKLTKGFEKSVGTLNQKVDRKFLETYEKLDTLSKNKKQ